MTDCTLALGSHDPKGFSAGSDDEAVRLAIGLIDHHYASDVAANTAEIVTLMGDTGRLTRPDETLGEFLKRIPGQPAPREPAVVEPGDPNTPDCNVDLVPLGTGHGDTVRR